MANTSTSNRNKILNSAKEKFNSEEDEISIKKGKILKEVAKTLQYYGYDVDPQAFLEESRKLYEKGDRSLLEFLNGKFNPVLSMTLLTLLVGYFKFEDLTAIPDDLDSQTESLGVSNVSEMIKNRTKIVGEETENPDESTIGGRGTTFDSDDDISKIVEEFSNAWLVK